MDLLLIVFVVFFISLIFSMLGLGGAIIYTPLFFLTGLPILTAIPMALLLNTITTASASITYLKQRIVNLKIACPIITASIPGALAGSYLARLMVTEILILLLSLILFFAAMRLLFFKNVGLSLGLSEKKKIMFAAGMGFLIGSISSTVGVGGGTFIVPLLLILGLETKNATATSSFIITFIALFGFLGHMSLGIHQLDSPEKISMLFYAGTAAFTGAQAGSRIIFRHVSSRTINRMFALVLLLVAYNDDDNYSFPDHIR